MPRLSVQHIIDSRNDRGLEIHYNAHCQPHVAIPRPIRYTRADFKKLNNLLLLLRENFTGEVPPYDSRRIIIRDNNSSYYHFGCSLNSLANSLTRVITFIRHNFPQDSAATNENDLIPTIVLTPQTQRITTPNGYLRSTVVSMIIDFRNCNDLISAIRDASTNLYAPQRNRTISNFGRGMPRRNMPTPQITLNQAQVNINVEAIRLDEAREIELNDNYQRNLSQLLRNAERESYSREFELSSSVVSTYISNAINTFENERFNSIDSNTRRIISNAGTRFVTHALNMVMNNNSRATFSDNTLDITSATADWRHGVIQTNGADRYNVGFRLGRTKVEEWLAVGNRGQNRNRTRMNAEIRERIRHLNTIFECFGASITTTKIRDEEGTRFRIFVLSNIPRYGIRFTEGISPLAIPTTQQNEAVSIPDFFRDPLAGMDSGFASIFNFLRGLPQGEERQLAIEEVVSAIPLDDSPQAANAGLSFSLPVETNSVVESESIGVLRGTVVERDSLAQRAIEQLEEISNSMRNIRAMRSIRRDRMSNIDSVAVGTDQFVEEIQTYTEMSRVLDDAIRDSLDDSVRGNIISTLYNDNEPF